MIENAMPEEMVEKLPEKLREELARMEEQRQQQVANLTQSLIQKRRRAIDWRASIGIEQEWVECEEAYEGIDDANRATEQPASARLTKPRNPSGGAIGGPARRGSRSTVFLNITRPYTDAAAARVADMLLPTDDRNFAIQPTPIPDLGVELIEQLTPELMAQMGIESPEDIVRLQQEEAKERADNAQTRIDDWLTECQYHAEARKVIEDCARLGSGVIKGPVPTKRKRRKASQRDGEITLEIVGEIAPQSVRVDPWDLFPDPSCGENIHNGSFLFERDRVSAKQLRDLIGQPGYLEEEIMMCLDEGPSKINVVHDGRMTREDDRFEIWYFHGQISEDDLSAIYKTNTGESGGEHVNVCCTMVNDRMIKAAPSHLDSGEFPYDLMPWQRRSSMPFGIGVAKQISVPQRMVNAGTRNMNDNAGLSSAPQIVMKKGVVTPADGTFELVPRKVWFADPDADVNDVKMAFMAVEIPTRQNELMNIIQFALKMAEDVTGLPMLMQGNQGKAPDTVGGMAMLNNNANTVLRRIARLFDDAITEPHMRRYYEWIMLYGDDSEKGDFIIDARGSTSLVDRDIQQQAIMAMGPMVLDPRFGADPEKWFEEALKANKIDPKRIMLTDERKEALQLAAQEQHQHEMEMQQAEREHDAALKQAEIDKDLTINREDNELEREKFEAEAFLKGATGQGR